MIICKEKTKIQYVIRLHEYRDEIHKIWNTSEQFLFKDTFAFYTYIDIDIYIFAVLQELKQSRKLFWNTLGNTEYWSHIIPMASDSSDAVTAEQYTAHPNIPVFSEKVPDRERIFFFFKKQYDFSSLKDYCIMY